MQKIKNIELLIELIRQKNPLIFLRIPSISYLAMFIGGYEAAIRDHCHDCDDHIMRKFNGWIKLRYRESTCVHWDNILLDIAGNEADALQLFWQCWDEFLVDYHSGVEIICDFNDDLKLKSQGYFIMQKTKTFELLIELIRLNPQIYLRIPSITHLAMFIDGYGIAIEAHCPDRDDDIMCKFNGWVKFRYEKSLSVWDHILLEIAGNEADALQLFWQWWDEFLVDYHSGVEIRCDFGYEDLKLNLPEINFGDLSESDDLQENDCGQ
jgi:hypothetical protein